MSCERRAPRTVLRRQAAPDDEDRPCIDEILSLDADGDKEVAWRKKRKRDAAHHAARRGCWSADHRGSTCQAYDRHRHLPIDLDLLEKNWSIRLPRVVVRALIAHTNRGGEQRLRSSNCVCSKPA